MINAAMLWFFLPPIVLGASLWFFTRERKGSWMIAVGYSVIGMLVIVGSFYGAKGVLSSSSASWQTCSI